MCLVRRLIRPTAAGSGRPREADTSCGRAGTCGRRSRRAVAPEPAEHVPEVGDEGAQARDDGRALEVPRDEPAPAPLVLHLVEDVLAVAALAVELRDRADVKVEVGDEPLSMPTISVPSVSRPHLLLTTYSFPITPYSLLLAPSPPSRPSLSCSGTAPSSPGRTASRAPTGA